MSAASAATTRQDTARRMAEAMRDVAFTEGGCSAADLSRRGFSRAAIERHGEEARRIARKLAVRRR